MLLALSLCNGGNACHCLSQCVYDFLVYGEDCRAVAPTISDIPDEETKELLSKVANSQSEAEFTHSVNNEPVLELLWASGYASVPKFSAKTQLVEMIAKYIVIDRPRSALEQFKDGLNTLGILQLMQSHPKEFESIFCHEEKKLSADECDSLFTPMFGPIGSNIRERQELIVMYWRDYLQDCEGTVY